MLRRIILRDPAGAGWSSYDRPVRVLAAASAAEAATMLREAEAAVDAGGLHAAGYVAYEAAPAFDASFRVRRGGNLPLALLGIFRAPTSLATLPRPEGTTDPGAWALTTGREDYVRNIDRIRRQIELGNCYQVNYTIRKAAAAAGDPWELFLRIGADAPYAAYIECDDFAVVSASPELFFALDGECITCRPMKGTARRGMTAAEDDRIVAGLCSSAKNRAENVMIADMVRNDLGRIAAPGSVRPTALYEPEKYSTVWQMTSSIEARTTAPLADIFAALFPCASVTGAPKTAAMSIIADLETSPRGVYTGAIGACAPGRQARFSVAIRTAVVERHTGAGEYGVGGGIVWDSDAVDEYRECQAKARVLEAIDSAARDFELLETLRWQPDEGYFLRRYHLERMLDSARYFDYPLRRDAVDAALDSAVAGFGDRNMRVRLLVERGGTARVEAEPLGNAPGGALRLCLAAGPVDEQNPFLFHKTTRRRVYDEALATAGSCDDVLLWNRAGFVTESTRANVIVRLRGRDYTPPVDCGLLAGTYRRWLLETTDLAEREIHVDELPEADGIVLVNSVRGRMRALLVDRGVALPA